MFLADLGAEVIKVENAAIGGDPARKTGPYLLGDGDSEYFQTWNMNKKSVALDLRRPRKARPRFEQLVRDRRCRDQQPARRPAREAGARLREPSSVKPPIVCVHLSAYGRDNERAALAGLRLPDAGRGRPHAPHRRARRPAHAHRRASMVDSCTGLTAMVGPARRRHPGARAPARAATSTPASSTSRCTSSATRRSGT